MNKNKILLPIMGLACVSLLVACGGGSSSSNDDTPPTTLTGIFNDSPVDGLAYSCAPSGMSGITKNGGTFNYVAGDSCTFSLGAVTLGSAAGAGIITPVELVANGSPSHDTVVNIVQLLTTADDDGDLSNGINITAAVRTAAENWTDVNVQSSSFDLDAAVVQMVADMYAAGGASSSLTDPIVAQAHIKATATCVYSGLYNGSWNGGSLGGEWGVVVLPDLTAQGLSEDTDGGSGLWSGGYNPSTNLITLSGSHVGVAFEPDPISNPGVTTTATFNGTVTGSPAGTDDVSGTMDGTVSFSPDYGVLQLQPQTSSGTFTGARLAGSATAKYRYTGFYSLTGSSVPSGVFSVDISDSGIATGTTFNFSTNTIGSVSGTAANGTINGSGDTTAVNISYDLAAGTMTGSWSDSADASDGLLSASGCQLN